MAARERVFISFASEDRQAAEELHFALLGVEFQTFYDRESLPAGTNYRDRIRSAVEKADFFVFLISPESVQRGRYTLTELQYAKRKWPHPQGRLLPVMLRQAPWDNLPAYLTSVTVFEPRGNMPAEVTMALEDLASVARAGNGKGFTVTLATMTIGDKYTITLRIDVTSKDVVTSYALAVDLRELVNRDFKTRVTLEVHLGPKDAERAQMIIDHGLTDAMRDFLAGPIVNKIKSLPFGTTSDPTLQRLLLKLLSLR